MTLDYSKPTEKLARDMLGKIIVSVEKGKVTAGIIVETEAYLGKEDPASHAYPGITKRNMPMWGPPGRTYVYLSYGINHCLNITTEKEGKAGAVLIRALEPVEGIEIMEKRRNSPENILNLTNGPGKLTQALGITLKHNAEILNKKRIFLLPPIKKIRKEEITKSRRIGISRNKEALLRFYIKDNPFVSGK